MKKSTDEFRDRIYEEYHQYLKKDQRIIKVIVISGMVVGGLYFSKYLINAIAGTVSACKNLKKAIKE